MSSVDFTCETCSKTFAYKVDLQNHVRRNHRAPSLTCFHCSYTTKFKFLLARHMRSCVRFNPTRRIHRGGHNRKCTTLTCPLCNYFQCVERGAMIEHYTEMHGVKIIEKLLDFAHIDAFDDWKKQTEASGCFRFKLEGRYEAQDGCRKKFRCFRDGFYYASGEGKRRLKVAGSCKINGVCPCSLKIAVSNTTGAIKASYIPCHVGHTSDIARMNLTKEEKKSIAEKLSENIPINVILDTIRGSVIDGDYNRIHLTTSKDLRNIKESIECKHKHRRRKSRSRLPAARQAAETLDEYWLWDASQGGPDVYLDRKRSTSPEVVLSPEVTVSNQTKPAGPLTNQKPGASHVIGPSRHPATPALTDQEPESSGDFFISKREDNIKIEITEEVSAIENHAVKATSGHDLEIAKEALIREFASIIQLTKNMDAIDVIRNAIAPIPHILQAIDLQAS